MLPAMPSREWSTCYSPWSNVLHQLILIPKLHSLLPPSYKDRPSTARRATRKPPLCVEPRPSFFSDDRPTPSSTTPDIG